jgi:hypothetical protein
MSKGYGNQNGTNDLKIENPKKRGKPKMRGVDQHEDDWWIEIERMRLSVSV